MAPRNSRNVWRKNSKGKQTNPHPKVATNPAGPGLYMFGMVGESRSGFTTSCITAASLGMRSTGVSEEKQVRVRNGRRYLTLIYSRTRATQGSSAVMNERASNKAIWRKPLQKAYRERKHSLLRISTNAPSYAHLIHCTG